MYRAARFQDFVYFSQQVHLYNQKEMTSLQHSNNEAVSLDQIDPGARASLVMPKKKPSVWKLPFRLDDVPFFDTTYMCDPLSVQGNKVLSGDIDHESWDAPLRRSHSKAWRESSLQVRDKEVQTSSSPISGDKYINNVDNFIEMPYTRDPKQNVSRKQFGAQDKHRQCFADKNINKMPANQIENNQFYQSRTSMNQFDRRDFNSNQVIIKGKPSYSGSSHPRSDLPRPYQKSNVTPISRKVAPQNDNSYHRDGDNNSSQNWNFPRSTSPSFKAKNEYNRREESPTKTKDFGRIKNPIEELKMKGRQICDENETDDPPFNFQAMLRKTNTNRASLRRGYEQQADSRDGHVVYSSPQHDESPPPSYSSASSANSWQGVEGERIMEELESVVNEMEAEESSYCLTTTTELAPGIVVQGLVAEL